MSRNAPVLMSVFSLICGAVSAQRLPEIPVPAPESATVAEFAAWRDHIRPTKAELAWRAIPWKRDLAAGIRSADRQDKPVLLWTMNGHPLGCT